MFFGPSGHDHDPQKPIILEFGYTKLRNKYKAKTRFVFKQEYFLTYRNLGNQRF